MRKDWFDVSLSMSQWGHKNQNMAVSSELLILLQTKLAWWYIIISGSTGQKTWLLYLMSRFETLLNVCQSYIYCMSDLFATKLAALMYMLLTGPRANSGQKLTVKYTFARWQTFCLHSQSLSVCVCVCTHALVDACMFVFVLSVLAPADPVLSHQTFCCCFSSVPVYFIWMNYLSWFKYANEILSVNQWHDVTKIGNCSFNIQHHFSNYLKGET